MGRWIGIFGGKTEGASSFRHTFQGLQSLLGENSRLLEVMADLEGDLRFLPAGTAILEVQIESLLQGTLLLIEDLNRLAGGRFRALFDAHARIEKQIRSSFVAHRGPRPGRWILPLAELDANPLAEAGGKGARLGELRRVFPEHVPDGFVVTANTYHAWVAEPPLAREMRALIEGLEAASDRDRLRSQAERMRQIIERAPLPRMIDDELRDLATRRFSSVRSWAVRSSAVGEDGQMSFAGQFESVLNVPPAELSSAYKRVVASRFSERAITYRLSAGILDVHTPMAVLFIPLVEARSAGVLYTRDPGEPGQEELLLTATWGLARDLVSGEAPADTFRVDRRDLQRVIHSDITSKESRLVAGAPLSLVVRGNAPEKQTAPSLDPAEIAALADLGLKIERHFEAAQDIEWAIDERGKIWILQTRPLRLVGKEMPPAFPTEPGTPVLSGGLTISPGRAVAPALVVHASEKMPRLSEGVILVVPQATPEIASLLPYLAGFIAERGHPTGHAATLLREFAVPSLFEVPGATERLPTGEMIGLDATQRQIYLGEPWPDVRGRTLARLARPSAARAQSPLHDLILSLTLTDPTSHQFKPAGCRSIHDVIRFVHEKAVATFFAIGDRETRGRLGTSRLLETPVPLNIHVLDLTSAVSPEASGKKRISPEQIRSVPFQALWRGMSHPLVSWTGRREISLAGFASVMAASLGQEMGSMRKLGEANYLLVAPDYLNLNIKLAYHYAMVDALVGAAAENNYINFRFRGGGAAQGRRDLRAQFLTEVLRRSRFAVDRRGDLVTAWLRRYPQKPAEEGLELLGKLTVCARQLDMLMDNETSVQHFVERFLANDYQAFS